VELTSESKDHIRRMMLKYGGGFAKAIAEAYGKADLENQRKIERAFPELFETYAQFTE
jgi:hypothetical protein